MMCYLQWLRTFIDKQDAFVDYPGWSVIKKWSAPSAAYPLKEVPK
jgi:hypothetical protein